MSKGWQGQSDAMADHLRQKWGGLLAGHLPPQFAFGISRDPDGLYWLELRRHGTGETLKSFFIKTEPLPVRGRAQVHKDVEEDDQRVLGEVLEEIQRVRQIN